MKKTALLLTVAGLVLLSVACACFKGKAPKEGYRKVVAVSTKEGDGANVNRLFPTRRMKHHDPFVLLDEFFVTPPAGFPMHGHKGFEAVTYMLEGTFKHEDTLGNKSTVGPGGAQRFTAGRGIMHSEMPGSNELSHGLQLWINLPRDLKQTPASYQQVNPGEFPEEKKKGLTVRHVIGNGSPLKVHTDVVYQDIRMDQAGKHTIRLDGAWNGLLYCLEGAFHFDDASIQAGEAIVFDRMKTLPVHTTATCRFVVIAGKPLDQPIKQSGPIVE